jgi:hypothetical protein
MCPLFWPIGSMFFNNGSTFVTEGTHSSGNNLKNTTFVGALGFASLHEGLRTLLSVHILSLHTFSAVMRFILLLNSTSYTSSASHSARLIRDSRKERVANGKFDALVQVLTENYSSFSVSYTIYLSPTGFMESRTLHVYLFPKINVLICFC